MRKEISVAITLLYAINASSDPPSEILDDRTVQLLMRPSVYEVGVKPYPAAMACYTPAQLKRGTGILAARDPR